MLSQTCCSSLVGEVVHKKHSYVYLAAMLSETVCAEMLSQTCRSNLVSEVVHKKLSYVNLAAMVTETVYAEMLSQTCRSNLVGEAELVAIYFGVRWALENHKSINIHTDSQSSIKALRSARSAFVISVKKNFYMAGHLVGLDLVKAHVGDPGNELADRHAKIATLEGEELNVPTLYSYINSKLAKNSSKTRNAAATIMIRNLGGGSGP
ncbi:hypothetical protein AVEN_226697-1 [Araneus ventricosus]|uniref:RNase H type-1 domain-containing protein n=1 Tax=Araneus ventricosus TaxID=182803 RepID=A0A4Y2CZA9_ARAVE|nr:hypothetical protein AVEN_226697-1 [Araneus ventricosus]